MYISLKFGSIKPDGNWFQTHQYHKAVLTYHKYYNI